MGSIVIYSVVGVNEIVCAVDIAGRCEDSLIGAVACCTCKKAARRMSQGTACSRADIKNLVLDFAFDFTVIEICGTKYSAAEKCENLHLASPQCSTAKFVFRFTIHRSI